MLSQHDPIKDSSENLWANFTSKDYVKQNIETAKVNQMVRSKTQTDFYKPKEPWLKHQYATVSKLDQISLNPKFLAENLRAN